MLVLKKISIKKLAIYISIMVVMFGSTGYVLYRNQLIPGFTPSANDNQLANDNFIMTDSLLPDGKITPDRTLVNSAQFDLTIFSSEKFKALEENILIYQGQPDLGKRDIFKPN